MSRLALICALFTAAAAGVAHSDNPGFFKPTPDGDVALTKIVPPKDAATVAAEQAAAAERQQAAVAPAAAAQQRQAQRRAEEDLDRADREAGRERDKLQQAPRPLAEGAFNGQTDEKSR